MREFGAEDSWGQGFTTDTVPIPESKRLPNMKILSVAPLLGEVMRRIHEAVSVGQMFNE